MFKQLAFLPFVSGSEAVWMRESSSMKLGVCISISIPGHKHMDFKNQLLCGRHFPPPSSQVRKVRKRQVVSWHNPAQPWDGGKVNANPEQTRMGNKIRVGAGLSQTKPWRCWNSHLQWSVSTSPWTPGCHRQPLLHGCQCGCTQHCKSCSYEARRPLALLGVVLKCTWKTLCVSGQFPNKQPAEEPSPCCTAGTGHLCWDPLGDAGTQQMSGTVFPTGSASCLQSQMCSGCEAAESSLWNLVSRLHLTELLPLN